MKNYPGRAAAARTYRAHAVADVYPIKPARSLDRTIADGKHDRVALLEGDNLDPRLHARPLLGKDELATFEILTRRIQLNRDLDWKHMLAIEILMQAIETINGILQQ